MMTSFFKTPSDKLTGLRALKSVHMFSLKYGQGGIYPFPKSYKRLQVSYKKFHAMIKQQKLSQPESHHIC